MSLTSADETPPGTSDRRRLSRPVRTAVEWVVIVAAALIAALLVKTFLFQPFYIPSESMVPTLRINDRVLVNKLDRDPERGRIFVFKRPSATTPTPLNKDLIKRVIGEPGDKVEGREGQVFVNDRPVAEPYLPQGTATSSFGPVTLTADQVWVMGDNRGASMDSRTFGPIDKDSIVGRAFVLFWPPGELKTL